jgi:hypothetical protein
MNDFHILSICIQNKDVAGAMRVLRDKSEFAVRKILEKLKSGSQRKPAGHSGIMFRAGC